MSTTTCFEDFKGFSAENWTRVESFRQLLEQPVNSWLTYTRTSYLPPAEFKKACEESKRQGNALMAKKRKKITCVIKEIEHETGTLTVESVPRKFKDDKRELKTLSWKLRDNMKGDVNYYIQVHRTEEQIEQLKEQKKRKRRKVEKDASQTESTSSSSSE